METADRICGILWGDAAIAVYLFAGMLFASVCVRGLFCKKASRSSPPAKQDSRSMFRAVTTALAASMGTGNITGVAAAITIGGAGAVVWMCIAAVFGSFIAFAETVLGIHYRYKKDGVTVGGPPAYIEKGIGSKGMAAIYCAVCAVMALGIGAMTQSNSVTSAVSGISDVPAWLCAVAVTAAAGAVIIGGRKRIGAVCEKLVPIMSVLYLVGCVILIVKFRDNIPEAVSETFNSAFGIRQAAGGIGGYGIKRAMSVGLRRGIFSNEAGLGSASVVHSQADAPAVIMGKLAAAEVLFDTVICCTATAAAVIMTGAYKSGADGAAMVIEGFSRGYGAIAAPYVTAAICLFAFATIVGWEYCGERCLDSLTSGSGRVLYRLLYCAALFFGGAAPLGIVWSISDILNWLAAAINIAALLMLTKKLRAVMKPT